MYEVLEEYKRLADVSDTIAHIFSQILQYDPESLDGDQLAHYRCLCSDLVSISNHLIQSYGSQMKSSRALKAQAFSLRKGETPDSIEETLRRYTKQ